MREGVQRMANNYRRSYELFMEANQNEELDEQVIEYLNTLEDTNVSIKTEKSYSS